MKKNRIDGWRVSIRYRKKLYLFMKLYVLLSIFFTVQATAVTHSQNQKLVINIEGGSLEQMIQQIKKQSDYRFLYNLEEIAVANDLNLHLESNSIAEVMKEALSGKDLDFKIVNEVIIVSPAPGKAARERQRLLQQQSVTITGRVTDSKGEPIPGVNIFEKAHPTNGVISGSRGEYTLKVSSDQALITFSFIGFESQEIAVNGRQVVDVTLPEEETGLNEVVVTGYFNRTKDSYTGTAVRVDADQLRNISTSDVLSTLAVIDPSFKQVENTDLGSNPNNIPEYTIRGGSSLQSEFSTSPNMPTFILDGFEVSAEKVFDLDPNRVKSMTILKDASATAIYGSRASNGVVVIETLDPQEGQLRVNYNFTGELAVADLSFYNLMNAREKLEYERLAGLYEHPNVSYHQDLQALYNEKLKLVEQGINTDWLAKPINDLGFSQKHFALIEGGDDHVRYGLNVNYNDTRGVMKESGRKNISIGNKLQYNYKAFRFMNDLSFANVKMTNSPYGSFNQYAMVNPYYSPYNETGSIKRMLMDYSQSYDMAISNPLYNTSLSSIDQSQYSEFINNLSVEWDMAQGLKLKGQVSVSQKKTSGDVYKPASHTDFLYSDYKGQYSKTERKESYIDGNLVLSYFKNVGKHMFNLAGIYNVREEIYDTYSFYAINFPNDNMDHISMGTNYPDGGKPNGDYNISRLMGVVTNVNYGYDNRYLLDLAVRSDGSSVYGANQRWGTFGSVGLAWNLNNEAFLKGSSLVQLLKIRGSVGTTGGQNFYPFQALQMLTYNDPAISNQAYLNRLGVVLKAYGNENLKWQKNLKRNIGVDFALLNNRLSGYFNVYNDVSKSVLIDVLLAPSTGFNSFKDNLGEVENKGFELNIKGSLIKNTSKQLQWDVFASLFHNKNALLNLNDALIAFNDKQDQNQNESQNNKVIVRYEEGRSINTIWANESLGIDPVTGDEIFLDAEGNKTNEWSSANYKPLGNSDRDLEGNFGTMLFFKNLQLNAFFNCGQGGDIYNQTLVNRVENVNPLYNADKRVLYDRWKKPGDIARYKAIGDQSITLPTSRFIEEENFLRCSSVNISYMLPAKFLERLNIERFKLTLYGNDLFRLSTVKMERGTIYPYARNYSLAAQITF